LKDHIKSQGKEGRGMLKAVGKGWGEGENVKTFMGNSRIINPNRKDQGQGKMGKGRKRGQCDDVAGELTVRKGKKHWGQKKKLGEKGRGEI